MSWRLQRQALPTVPCALLAQGPGRHTLSAERPGEPSSSSRQATSAGGAIGTAGDSTHGDSNSDERGHQACRPVAHTASAFLPGMDTPAFHQSEGALWKVTTSSWKVATAPMLSCSSALIAPKKASTT